MFANIYLNGLDHQLKEQFHAKKYVRYMDDFAIFADDRDWLTDIRHAIEHVLATFRLRIHPVKSQICAVRHGANFLGFRVFPDHWRVRSENLRRARGGVYAGCRWSTRQDVSVRQTSRSRFEAGLLI